jgi:hypothetical protein
MPEMACAGPPASGVAFIADILCLSQITARNSARTTKIDDDQTAPENNFYRGRITV